MKKLVLFLFIQGTFFALHAQEKNKIYYGMEGGFTISFFDQKNAPFLDPSLVEAFDKAARTSFELGATADYLVSDLLSFSSGLMYTERGGSYKTKNPDFVYVNQFSGSQQSDAYNYLRYRLSYFEIPLTANINLFELLNVGKEDQSLNVFVGGSGMVNMSSKLRYNTFEGSSDPEEKWEANDMDAANAFVFGFNSGVEWRGGPLTFYVEYSSNLSDPYDTSEPGFENFDIKMSTISLGMGVWFGTKLL